MVRFILIQAGFFIRFQGTEPLLRLFCEMQDKVQAQRINDLVEEYYSLRKMEAYR